MIKLYDKDEKCVNKEVQLSCIVIGGFVDFRFEIYCFVESFCFLNYFKIQFFFMQYMSIGLIIVEFFYQLVNIQFKVKYILVKNIIIVVLDNYFIF